MNLYTPSFSGARPKPKNKKPLKKRKNNSMASHFLNKKITVNDFFTNPGLIGLLKNLDSFEENPQNTSQVKNIWKNKKELYEKLNNYEKNYEIPADLKSQLRFQRISLKKHFESFEHLNNSIKRTVGNHFDFNKILTSKNMEINYIVKKKIVKLYNFLINSGLISESNLLKLIFYCSNNPSHYEPSQQVKGLTLFVKNNDQALSAININKDWLDTDSEHIAQYEKGFMVSPEAFNVFTHEMGHLLHHFYSLNSTQKKHLNSWTKFQGEPNKIFINDFHWQLPEDIDRANAGIDCSKVINLAKKFFYNKFNNLQDQEIPGIDNSAQWFDYVLSITAAVPSEYSRQDLWDKSKKGSLRSHEWFADALAFFQSKKEFESPSRVWQWWNEFFLEILPAHFNKQN